MESPEIPDQVDQLGVKDFKDLKATWEVLDRLVVWVFRASKAQQDQLEHQVAIVDMSQCVILVNLVVVECDSSAADG